MWYLVQSRSKYRHKEAIVDVTKQLGADGRMSHLRETKMYTYRVKIKCVCVCVCVRYLGNSTTKVQRVQKVDQSRNLLTQTQSVDSFILINSVTNLYN